MAPAVQQGGASRSVWILVAGFRGQASTSGSGNLGAIACLPWQAFAAPALALSLRDWPGRLRSALPPRKPRWRFPQCFGWHGRALHRGWLVRVGSLAGLAQDQTSPAARPPHAIHGKPSRLLPWSTGAERAPWHLPAPHAAPQRLRFAQCLGLRGGGLHPFGPPGGGSRPGGRHRPAQRPWHRRQLTQLGPCFHPPPPRPVAFSF